MSVTPQKEPVYASELLLNEEVFCRVDMIREDAAFVSILGSVSKPFRV